MRKIKVKELTAENFKHYGTFASMVNPEGPSLAFSPLVSRKPEKMIITTVEYHDTTCEGVLPLDDDAILHVAPASKDPVPELTEAFYVPKGTFVKLNVGVWHLAALPVHNDVMHVMITLPERIYKSDCVVVDYKEEDYIEIEM